MLDAVCASSHQLHPAHAARAPSLHDVRQFYTPSLPTTVTETVCFYLRTRLVTNNVSFPTAPWSLMMSRENKVGTFEVVFDPTILRVQPKLNTGVLYGYVEPAQQDRTERFLAMLRFWQSSTCSQSLCEVFTKEHPWEQGCMEKLVFNASLSSAEKQLLQSVHVSQQPMNLWNGPWGIFVRHVWAGPGVEKREDMFTDMIDSYDIDVPTSLATIKADMLAPSISSTRSCNEQGEAMERAEAPSPQASLPKSRIQSGTSGSRSDVPRVPFPDGVATSGGSAKGRSKIRPECLTIVQTSNCERGGCHFCCPYESGPHSPGLISKASETLFDYHMYAHHTPGLCEAPSLFLHGIMRTPRPLTVIDIVAATTRVSLWLFYLRLRRPLYHCPSGGLGGGQWHKPCRGRG